MMLELNDVLSEEEIEELIEQHDSYEFRDCHLVRSKFGYESSKTWVVYYRGKAIETYLKKPRPPKLHAELAKALESALVFDSLRADGEINEPD